MGERKNNNTISFIATLSSLKLYLEAFEDRKASKRQPILEAFRKGLVIF